jgi:CRP-like cAMP-binding protein
MFLLGETMSLDDEIAMMAKLPVLSELDDEALRVLAFSADTRNLNAGNLLLRRGERSEGGYFVISGSLSLFRDANQEFETGVVGVGGLIGEMAMIAATENAVSAIAREPTTVLRIPRTLFQRVLREYPGSAARLRSAIEKHLLAFTTELEKLRLKTKDV